MAAKRKPYTPRSKPSAYKVESIDFEGSVKELKLLLETYPDDAEIFEDYEAEYGYGGWTGQQISVWKIKYKK